MSPPGATLAHWAVKSRPASLYNPSDRGVATRARHSRAVINQEPFLVAPAPFLLPVVEKAIGTSPHKIQRHGAAEANRVADDITDRHPYPADFIGIELSAFLERRNSGSAQGFAGVDISDAGDESLVHQLHLHRLTAAAQSSAKIADGKFGMQRFRS